MPFLQLRLRPPSMAFGQVVVGSWLSQDVLLSNIGELPMAFRFSNSESHPGLISISPSYGTLQPRANQPVTVTFRPAKVIRHFLPKAVIAECDVRSKCIQPGAKSVYILGQQLPSGMRVARVQAVIYSASERSHCLCSRQNSWR